MKIRFLKKTQDIRDGRTKYFAKNEAYSMSTELGSKYLESGDAELYTLVKEKKIKKKKVIKKIEDNGEV